MGFQFNKKKDGSLKRTISMEVGTGEIEQGTRWEIESPKISSPFTIRRDTEKKLSVVIPAMNEEDTLEDVLIEVKKLIPDEIVVVVNGSTDKTALIARKYDAKVIEFHDRIGHDVGRAVGALHTDADIYLFTDADIPIPVEDLYPFVEAIENGDDLALNSICWVTRYPKPDAPTIDRVFINMVQEREDLGVENVLTIPHAFSKKGLDTISKEALANPQLANALAIDKGLRISVPIEINVLRSNKRRSNHKKEKGEIMSKAYQRMHGDTIEAIQYLLDEYGERGIYKDNLKFKAENVENLITQWKQMSISRNISIVLSISPYTVCLRNLLDELVQCGVEIIPVVQMPNSLIVRELRRYELPFVKINQFIGQHSVFALGAQLAQGGIIVFHDTSSPIKPWELAPYYEEIMQNKIDMTINNQGRYLGKMESMHTAHIGNLFMNIVGSKNEIATSSMLIPPFGLTKEALERLNPITLMIPMVAHMKAIHLDFSIKPIHEIDYIGRITKQYRPIIVNEERLKGDILEGLAYWNSLYGIRGGFFDEGRNRELLTGSKYLKTNFQSFTKVYENHNISILNDITVTK